MEDEIIYVGGLRRFWACLVDALGILILILLIFLFGFFVLGWSNDTAFLWPPAWFIIYSFYTIGFWSRKGQTLGKSLLKVKIVRTDKKPINLSISMLRYFTLVGPYIVFIIGGFCLYTAKSSFINHLAALGALVLIPVLPVLLNIVIINMSSTRQGPHDRVAHTFVIQTK
jgi:uncharacterized RDD family membrane protein YckC